MGMGLVTAIVLCFFITVVDGNRKKRVASGKPVNDTLRYPWMVFIVSAYGDRTKPIRTYRKARCGGSFVDIYGSVLTAAHCVRRERQYMVNNESRTLQLLHVEVTWGILVPYYIPSSNTETVRDLGEIKRYKLPADGNILAKILRGKADSKDVPPREVDIALIYLATFQKSPMVCKKSDPPKPIELSKGGRNDWRRYGIFAGFGTQPVEWNGIVLGFKRYGQLTQIFMKYNYHMKPFPRLLYPARYKTNTRTSQFAARAAAATNALESDDQLLRISGPCVGDSGGPCMVQQTDGLKQRGIYSLSEATINFTLPCYDENNFAFFVDVANKYVRNWILEELKARYKRWQGRFRTWIQRVPATC